MHRNQFADAPRRRGAGIGRGLHGPDVATHEYGHVPGANVFRPDEGHVCGLDHRVSRLDGPDETTGLDHTKRIALSFHLVDADDIMLILSMQRTVRRGGLLCSLGLLLTVCTAASCRSGEDTAPAVATAEVTLSRSRVAQGSPVDITYRFQPTSPVPAGNYRVFVHVVDADEELMWTDDHAPPTQPGDWQPGQKIEYTRTMFVPMYPYIGPSKIVVGVYELGSNVRLKLDNGDRGDRSYQLATFELLPQTENVYLVYRNGWHPAEVAPENPAIEWKWTQKEAILAFRNPKRDSTLILQVDNPAQAAGAASEVDVRFNDQSLEVIPVGASDAPIRKIALPASLLGDADMVEIRLVANRTFVPALEPSAKSSDTRELGVRVFHAFVQPN
jgi:hypothetical protein